MEILDVLIEHNSALGSEDKFKKYAYTPNELLFSIYCKEMLAFSILHLLLWYNMKTNKNQTETYIFFKLFCE